MALKVDLDYALQIVTEPGYWQGVGSIQAAREMLPTTDEARKAFWKDPAYGVIMKTPRQLDRNWINTEEQVSSIIGLTDHGAGIFVPNPTDTTNLALHETNVAQNPDNPWIHHSPVTPGVAAPSGVTGHGGQGSLVNLITQAELNIPAAAASPLPDSGDVKCLLYTQDDLRWNQPLFFRWYNPPALIGHPTFYGFMIGQYCVSCYGAMVEIHRDISEGKDRTSWRRVTARPLFSGGDYTRETVGSFAGTAFPVEEEAGERSLLWLPYRRHEVLLFSDKGRSVVLRVAPYPTLNNEDPDGDEYDWKIIEPRKLSVWALTKGSGRIQVQKVKFYPGSHSFRVNPFVFDYTPAVPLDADNVRSRFDAFRGSEISHSVPVTPPGYSVPDNDWSTCPEPTTGPGDQSRTYGFHFTMEAAPDEEFTPFFYGYDVVKEADVDTWLVSPTTISDNEADGTARIQRAEFSSSLKRGESDMMIEIADFPAFAAASQYFRSAAPVRLFDSSGPTALFIGISDPTEVERLRSDTAILRRMTVNAHDLWKVLEDCYLRDQRDWGPSPEASGAGHIFVVDFVARQAGIDTSGADYPPGGIGGAFDWPLGGAQQPMETMTTEVRPGWKPSDKPPDTAASFIERIASLFSGWDVGFYPNGQFYYRPKELYTASEVTFVTSGSAGPRYRRPVTYRHVEPELNVFQLEAISAETGQPLVSSRWVDLASIRNVNAPNFLGRWRAGYAKIDGGFVCPQLNHMAQIVWNAARRRHLLIRFEAEYYQPLKVGHCFSLQGTAGRWRLQNYSVEYTRTGWSPCSYEAELVERGSL